METMNSHNCMHIKYVQKRKQFEIAINYKKFNKALENLHKSNIIFSTYHDPNSTNGYIRLHPNLFIRISIIHKLGAIVTFNKKREKMDGLHMKIGRELTFIDWTIDENLFVKSSKKIFETKEEFRHKDLNQFYLELSIVADKELIQIKHTPSDEIDLLIGKDVARADRNRFLISPNSDGVRNRKEFFAGTGSNIGRRY